MNELTTEEKINLIIDQAEKHGITAYEFGTNTSISTFAAEQLLKRKTKKPGQKTILQMIEYIEKRIVGTDLKKKDFVAEPKSSYNPEEKEEISLLKDAVKQRDKIIELLEQENRNLREKLNMPQKKRKA